MIIIMPHWRQKDNKAHPFLAQRAGPVAVRISASPNPVTDTKRPKRILDRQHDL